MSHPDIALGGCRLDADDFLRDAIGRENVIDDSSFDRTVRHPVVLRRFGVLRESYATELFLIAEGQACRRSPYPTESHQRRSSSDRRPANVRTYRWACDAPGLLPAIEMQNTIGNRHVAIWRKYVQMVAKNLLAILGLMYGELGDPGQ